MTKNGSPVRDLLLKACSAGGVAAVSCCAWTHGPPACVFPTLPPSSEAREGGTNGPLELETEKGLLQGGQSKETGAQLLPTHSSWEGFRRAFLKVRLGGGGWGGRRVFDQLVHNSLVD